MGQADVHDARAGGPRRPDYGELYARLTEVDRVSGLGPADLERLAMAAYLTGREAQSVQYLARAHQSYLSTGETAPAVRSAFWLAFTLIHQSERAQAAGWVARAHRLLDECGQECVERGYLLLPAGLQQVAEGNIAAAERTFAEAARVGERHHDVDLANLARQGHGRALINLGRVAEGSALLDEVMVAVTGGELSPVVAGTVYCSVVEACFEMLDLRRAHEWTEALTRWCSSNPDVVPFRGLCRVRRAEMLVLRGEWPEATDQARQACEPAGAGVWPAALAAGFYQVAEVHRLRGEFADADEAYRLASESGRTPHPGLALLRLAQGRVEAARAAICRVVDEAKEKRTRVRCLDACVEILLASGDIEGARAAAGQLSDIGATLRTTYPRALAAQTRGAVRLAEGNAPAALADLREAWSAWRELDAPYEAARVSTLAALACRAVGDSDGARLELETARAAFQRLGAVPDLAKVDRLIRDGAGHSASGLTPREVEVLRLVASGKTNKAIAVALAISEKTVARHLSNIFTKLDLTSRAAATAYAFRHGLV